MADDLAALAQAAQGLQELAGTWQANDHADHRGEGVPSRKRAKAANGLPSQHDHGDYGLDDSSRWAPRLGTLKVAVLSSLGLYYH